MLSDTSRSDAQGGFNGTWQGLAIANQHAGYELRSNTSWNFLMSTHRALNKRAHRNRMGHSGDSVQTRGLFNLVSTVLPRKRVANNGLVFCEIGFNVGHSAATFLSAASVVGEIVTHYVLFDMGGHPAVQRGIKVLNESFPETTFIYLEGKSGETVPKYTTPGANNHPQICDLIHIDGEHFDPGPMTDWTNVQPLARQDSQTLVLFDDCHCLQRWCAGPTRLFKKLVAQKGLTKVGAGEMGWGKGKGDCVGLIAKGNPS